MCEDGPKPLSSGAPVKLGEVVRFFLGMANFNACEPVKVVITTDRGVATFNFE
jgi:hypothetical protein